MIAERGVECAPLLTESPPEICPRVVRVREKTEVGDGSVQTVSSNEEIGGDIRVGVQQIARRPVGGGDPRGKIGELRQWRQLHFPAGPGDESAAAGSYAVKREDTESVEHVRLYPVCESLTQPLVRCAATTAGQLVLSGVGNLVRQYRDSREPVETLERRQVDVDRAKRADGQHPVSGAARGHRVGTVGFKDLIQRLTVGEQVQHALQFRQTEIPFGNGADGRQRTLVVVDELSPLLRPRPNVLDDDRARLF